MDCFAALAMTDRLTSRLSAAPHPAASPPPSPRCAGRGVYSRLHERAPAFVQRAERVFRLDRRQDLEIVPLALRLGDGLCLEQVHRVQLAAVDADRALAEERI